MQIGDKKEEKDDDEDEDEDDEDFFETKGKANEKGDDFDDLFEV